ncbi:flagellar brake protein [Thiobacter aerophilum]|uniref:Flagellar brake protein YcgR n=1 Tax=Thiobacter aerophilum TaxID=3121275 RepID=A0ABV0EFG1_9BURK
MAEPPASARNALINWDAEQSEYARFLLRSRGEILQVLRGVAKGRELVTVYFDHGQRFFLSSLLAVEPGQDALFLDWGADEELNRRALGASRLVCVTAHERVKVQFTLDGLDQVQWNGRPAFRARLPKLLLKLQRREYYRLVCPLREPLFCHIPLKSEPLEAQVVDISVGGVGLGNLAPNTPLLVGERYPGCSLTLPGEGALLTTLEVRSLQDLALRNGGLVKRAGCRFVDLPAAQQAMIQRYIIRIDRERIALAKGA